MSSRKDMERLRNDKYQTTVRRVEAIASGSTRLTENSQWCYEVQEVVGLQSKSWEVTARKIEADADRLLLDASTLMMSRPPDFEDDT